MAKIAIVFVGLLALASVGQAVLNTDRCVAGVQQLLWGARECDITPLYPAKIECCQKKPRLPQCCSCSVYAQHAHWPHNELEASCV